MMRSSPPDAASRRQTHRRLHTFVIETGLYIAARRLTLCAANIHHVLELVGGATHRRRHTFVIETGIDLTSRVGAQFVRPTNTTNAMHHAVIAQLQ
jgi:hypothetical protein